MKESDAQNGGSDEPERRVWANQTRRAEPMGRQVQREEKMLCACEQVSVQEPVRLCEKMALF